MRFWDSQTGVKASRRKWGVQGGGEKTGLGGGGVFVILGGSEKLNSARERGNNKLTKKRRKKKGALRRNKVKIKTVVGGDKGRVEGGKGEGEGQENVPRAGGKSEGCGKERRGAGIV